MCQQKAGLEPFDVIVQNDGRDKQMGSTTKAVEMKVYNYTIIISETSPGVVTVSFGMNFYYTSFLFFLQC